MYHHYHQTIIQVVLINAVSLYNPKVIEFAWSPCPGWSCNKRVARVWELNSRVRAREECDGIWMRLLAYTVHWCMRLRIQKQVRNCEWWVEGGMLFVSAMSYVRIEANNLAGSHKHLQVENKKNPSWMVLEPGSFRWASTYRNPCMEMPGWTDSKDSPMVIWFFYVFLLAFLQESCCHCWKASTLPRHKRRVISL